MKRLAAILFVVPLMIIDAQIFERVTDESNPIVSTSMTANYSGAAWIDYNNDGLIDLFSSRSFLFKNLGAGEFEYIETALGEKSFGQSNGITWSDYDNDGDIDLFMAGNPSNLYENLGNDSFERIQSDQLNDNEDLRGWSAAWGDYDSDGFTDLVITHPRGFLGQNPTSNHLFRNNGGLLVRDSSTPVTTDIAPFTIPSFTDYDLDGDLDLFIGSGPAGSSARDFMYDNMMSQTGNFSYVRIVDKEFATDTQDGQVWNFIDYDNDGDLDGFVTNYGGAKNKFYKNDNGVFTNIQNELTISGSKLANSWGDFDNDGDLDVVVTGDSDNDLYLNNGDGSFTSIQHPIAALTSVSATLGDYDDDGDLDLFLSGGETALFENISDNSNNWVLISLEGTVSNRSAIGAKIKAKANIDGKAVWQIREVSSQNSFNGHNSLRVHFGLKDASIIDSLIILWPNSPSQVFENVEVNTIHKYVEPITENYIRVNFKSDIQFGFETPEIQFTDISLSDPNNPIVSWEWDFDNDGAIDATDQNPVYKYDSLGVYDVRLRVSNGAESVERVKENFIELILTPGIPIILSLSHTFSDTTVERGQRIEFSGAAEDTTGYEIIYNWELNSKIVDYDSTYRYAARSFPFVPRTDTLKFLASNGFNTTERIWYINVEDPTSVDKNKDLPIQYELSQNYPNPFNPSTTISYAIPERSSVSLKLYDILGKELITLVDEIKNPGFYSINFNANSEKQNFSSGIYIYQIRAGNFIQSQKMILMK